MSDYVDHTPFWYRCIIDPTYPRTRTKIFISHHIVYPRVTHKQLPFKVREFYFVETFFRRRIKQQTTIDLTEG